MLEEDCSREVSARTGRGSGKVGRGSGERKAVTGQGGEACVPGGYESASQAKLNLLGRHACRTKLPPNEF